MFFQWTQLCNNYWAKSVQSMVFKHLHSFDNRLWVFFYNEPPALDGLLVHCNFLLYRRCHSLWRWVQNQASCYHEIFGCREKCGWKFRGNTCKNWAVVYSEKYSQGPIAKGCGFCGGEYNTLACLYTPNSKGLRTMTRGWSNALPILPSKWTLFVEYFRLFWRVDDAKWRRTSSSFSSPLPLQWM